MDFLLVQFHYTISQDVETEKDNLKEQRNEDPVFKQDKVPIGDEDEE